MATATSSITVHIADLPKIKALTEGLSKIVDLHSPMPGDDWAAQRCSSCIAGYDPMTNVLCHVAWPCATGRLLQQMSEVFECGPR